MHSGAPVKRTWTPEPDETIVKGLKKIKITRTSAGQLRLRQDMGELPAPQNWVLRIDDENPLLCHCNFVDAQNNLFIRFHILVARFYPHTAPVITDAAGSLVKLDIVDHWRAVFTLFDILKELTSRILAHQWR